MTDRQLRIVVVGDTLLDVDVSGTSERLSPDAPVPVLDVRSEDRRAGGAGLVATMLAKDGHDVRLVTVLGDDAPADRLRSLLPGVTIVEGPSGAPTPVKTRVRVGDHALVRIDEGCDTPPVPAVTEAMRSALDEADAVIVADYGRGLTAAEEMRAALTAVAAHTPVVWDPHPKGEAPSPASPSSRRTPARRSASPGSAARASPSPPTPPRKLVTRWEAHAVAVTMGDRGALVGRRTDRGLDSRFVPAPSVTAGDPCGAGDRLAAGVAVALASGAEIADAVTAGVADASAYLAAGGVASLVAALPRPPSRCPGPTVTRSASPTTSAPPAGSSSRPVAASTSCTPDTPARSRRPGPSATAWSSASNSDDSVRGLKGPDRPIMARTTGSNSCSRWTASTPSWCSTSRRPTRPSAASSRRLGEGRRLHRGRAPRVGHALAEWGGRVVTVPFHPGRSTPAWAAAIERVG